MSGPLIILTGVIYLWVACDMGWRGNYPMAWTYMSYSLANVGLYFMAR